MLTPTPRQAFWTSWAFLAALEVIALCLGASSARLVGRSWLWHLLPLALLALAAMPALIFSRRGAARWERLRGGILGRLWWAWILAVWLAFWVLDLREARVQSVLGVVPVAAAVDWLRGVRVQTGPGAAAVSGWALVWHLFELRSHNGCTGVSDSYEWTLVLSVALLFLFGPWAAAGASIR
jgi:hypothetical protein